MTAGDRIGRDVTFGVVAAAAVWVLECMPAAAAAVTAHQEGNCRVGIYQLQDGSDVDIGLGNDAHLRWRRKDGTSGELTETPDGTWTSTLGWTSRPDGKRVAFPDCGKGEITFAGVKGQRIASITTEIRFESGGVGLAGRLVMPKGADKVPIVILMSGSEDFSARDYFALQRMFPTEGIGTFVYDKRGTGASEGSYTQNYSLLAKDAVAAMQTARRLAGARASRVGYQGGSQAGWVMPLAATLAPVDFIVVGYGLAVSPLEEDRSAIVLDMTRHGFGPDVIPKAMEVADATEAVITSNFKEGYDRVDAVRAKYGSEPWFQHVHGNFTFAVLGMPHDELRQKGPVLLPDVDPHYDPMPILRKLNTPQLWILGAEDIDAPSAETARRLAGLAAAGRPIVTAMFPHAEHGIFEYETSADGTRLSTRNSAGYFYMMRDYIRTGELHGRYGSSVISGRGR